MAKLADIRKPDGSLKRCYAHTLRHTFAVELLLAGVPMDQVSVLLGHRDVRTTVMHWAPWVFERQEQLAISVLKAWAFQGETNPVTTLNTDTGAETLVRSLQLLSRKLVYSVSTGPNSPDCMQPDSTTEEVGNVVVTLTALGIKVKDDAKGLLRRADDVLVDLSRVFQEMPDGNTKAALAGALFSDRAEDMVQVLNEGADRLRQLILALGEGGTEETARAA